MALQPCFRAQDTIWYDEWSAGDPAAGDFPFPRLVHYNSELIATPRYFGETLAGSVTANSYPGILWTSREMTPWGDTVINYFGQMHTVRWPSWGTARWKFDGQYGRRIARSGYNNEGTEAGSIYLGRFCYEPSGHIWEFAGHPFTDGWGAIGVAEDTMTPDASLGQVSLGEYSPPEGGTGIAIVDFNIDRNSDRVFIRFATNPGGRVDIFKISDKTYIASIYAPNETRGITLTHDGFIYLADAGDWLCVYNYDGVYHNALKNPRREQSLNFVYGWDKFYKRLLFASLIANSTNGQCRVRIRGFYPVPEPTGLTPPLPRSVPRKGRTITILSHLYGDGAEPIAGRQGQLSGNAAATLTSDRHGDFVAQTTPTGTGDFAATLTVETAVYPPDPPEPDAITVGKTLTIVVTRTDVGNIMNVNATVGNAVGDVTLTYYFMNAFLSVYKPVTSSTYENGFAESIDMNTGRGGWWVMAQAVDSTGNTGLSKSVW